MTDIVERLRAWAGARTVHAAMASEAAAEIERLRAALQEIEDSSSDPRAVREARAALREAKS